jgi:hypothetical protein
MGWMGYRGQRGGLRLEGESGMGNEKGWRVKDEG